MARRATQVAALLPGVNDPFGRAENERGRIVATAEANIITTSPISRPPPQPNGAFGAIQHECRFGDGNGLFDQLASIGEGRADREPPQ